jgi:lipopolysaccharide transport system ATP-binding protein
MGDVAREGRTVLFVSHNMGAVQQLCARAVLLNEGRLLLDDSPSRVVSHYLAMGAEHISERVWPDIEHAPGDDVARLCAVRVLDRYGNVHTQFDVRDPVYVEMEYCIFRDLDYLDASYYFYNERGELVFVSADDSFDSPAGGRPRPAGRYRATCHVPPDFLNEGQLYVQAALTQERRVHTIQRDVVMFQVGDAMDRQGARGNYHDGVWPPAAVRPRLRWTSNRTPLKPERL